MQGNTIAVMPTKKRGGSRIKGMVEERIIKIVYKQ